MTVLFVITGLSTGGAERALYNVLSGGVAERFGATVLSLRDEGTIGPWIRELGVPVHTLNMRSGVPGPRVITRLNRVVAKLAPDVVQGWMYHGNLAASLAARLAPSKPALAWNVRHCLYDLTAEKRLTRQVIRASRRLSQGADAILYNSRKSKNQHEAFGFNDAHGLMIPNGFDLGRLAPDAETGALVRRELGIPDDALVVGHVARFHPMKDHASFLRAAVRVARSNPVAQFLVVGREVNLDNPALIGIVPPDLVDRFTFPGERLDVHKLMQAMDVLSTSSAWGEAFPNVLGEAMACGVPCVATDIGDSADIVGDSGIVVSPSDSDALAQGLLVMLGRTTDERRTLGRAACRRVETNYGLDTVVEQYARLYDDLEMRERR